MPLSDLQSQLDAALADVESVTGETITIVSTNYACTRSSSPFQMESFETGGTFIEKKVTVNVRKTLLVSEPAEETSATFNSINYRVIKAHDSGAYWQLDLVEIEA